MDADLSHPPDVIERLWVERDMADVTIASRYVPGGKADMGTGRYVCSRLLNAVFSRGLDVPIRDLSSGFRLYRAAVIREQHITSRDFDILQQTIVQAFAEGWRVREVPFVLSAEQAAEAPIDGSCRSGCAWIRTFGELWLLRNSILAADYDDRAHDSRIFLQRYWQRARHRHVMELIAGEGAVLDIGCGSSRIIAGLPAGSVAVDILHRKLRYARRFKKPLVRGSGFALPFRDASFPCVLCSQVIEHVPKDSPILDELCRVAARPAAGSCSARRTTQTGSGSTSRSCTAWCLAATRTSTSRTTPEPSSCGSWASEGFASRRSATSCGAS